MSHLHKHDHYIIRSLKSRTLHPASSVCPLVWIREQHGQMQEFLVVKQQPSALCYQGSYNDLQTLISKMHDVLLQRYAQSFPSTRTIMCVNPQPSHKLEMHLHVWNQLGETALVERCMWLVNRLSCQWKYVVNVMTSILACINKVLFTCSAFKPVHNCLQVCLLGFLQDMSDHSISIHVDVCHPRRPGHMCRASWKRWPENGLTPSCVYHSRSDDGASTYAG